MSFILDALRKSEHERQRSATPGLSQVPLATPPPQMPRWALGVIVSLVAAVLVLGGAWWQSARGPADVAASAPASSSAPTVERRVDLPPPAPRSAAAQQAAPSRLPTQDASSLSAAAASSTGAPSPSAGAAETAAPSFSPPPRLTNLPDDSVALPSVAMLAAEGVAVPPLHLELHAFSAQPRDRFVFINGRKYVEGDRLVEGPLLVEIDAKGAVLTHAGRRFILVQE